MMELRMANGECATHEVNVINFIRRSLGQRRSLLSLVRASIRADDWPKLAVGRVAILTQATLSCPSSVATHVVAHIVVVEHTRIFHRYYGYYYYRARRRGREDNFSSFVVLSRSTVVMRGSKHGPAAVPLNIING